MHELDKIKSHNKQLTEEISNYQSDLKMTQLKINELQEDLNSLSIVKQKVCTYVCTCVLDIYILICLQLHM